MDIHFVDFVDSISLAETWHSDADMGALRYTAQVDGKEARCIVPLPKDMWPGVMTPQLEAEVLPIVRNAFEELAREAATETSLLSHSDIGR